MSKSNGQRGGGANTQPTQKSSQGRNAAEKFLNLRSPPIKVTGIPKDLFLIYDVILTVSGPDTIAVTLMEKGKRDGIPIPYSEISGLGRAAGFVKQNLKTTVSTELTEQTRSFFFKTKKDPRKASEPKLLVKKALDHQANLNKTLDMIKVKKAGDPENFSEAFIKEMAHRSAACASTLLHHGTEGKKEDPKIFLQNGIPKSLRSKFLTGSLPPTAPNLFSALVGKELEKFSSISIDEIQNMPEDLLSMFLAPAEQASLKILTSPVEVKKWFGLVGGAKLSEKQQGEIDSLSLPCRNFLSKLGTLERYDKTKELPKLKNLETSKFPVFDRKYNEILAQNFFVPPSDVAKVKDFWETISGIQMIDPSIGSKSYRVQTIEHLKSADQELMAPGILIPERECCFDVRVGNESVARLTNQAVSTTHQDGSVVHEDRSGFEKYQPFCIVGEVKTSTKKKLNSDGFNRRSDLTKISTKYLNALAQNGIPKHFLAEVKTYLMTFGLPQIQEIAAKTVYHTMHQTVKVAREFHLGEVPGHNLDADESEEEERKVDDNEDDQEQEEEDEPLPPPGLANGQNQA